MGAGLLTGQFADAWVWRDLAIPVAIAFFAPNTQQIMCRYRPALDFRGGAEGGGVLRFRIATPWMIASVLLLAAALTRGDAIFRIPVLPVLMQPRAFSLLVVGLTLALVAAAWALGWWFSPSMAT